MFKTPLQIYKHRLNSGDLRADPVQGKAVAVLDDLYMSLISSKEVSKTSRSGVLSYVKSKMGGGHGADNALKGVYMHGGVGRGKTMLMDLFYEALPEEVQKRRVHFHQFMIETHNYFHERRENDDFGDGIDSALPAYACRISETVRILCFDEFHVTDVADAMILGRLFTALFEQGVIVVLTTNWEPDRLYEGGLQRDRFLPFIELLKTYLDVIYLDTPTDYRMEFEGGAETYFYPVNEITQKKIDALFVGLTQGEVTKSEVLKVKGREILVEKVAGKVARFTFQQLCEQPHGAEDYIKIAQTYDTVFLENIRKMGYDRRNEAKRLMTLIDALYEAETKVVISAAAPPDKLYHGHDHAFEFDRTISRLMEMQSTEYGEG